MTQIKNNRCFLFLQGPITPFFKLIGDALEKAGYQALRINLCFGDWLFWNRPGATNYRGTLEKWEVFIETYYRKNNVTDLILLGEQREYHKRAIQIAKKLNIQVIATDFGYLRPDYITFEKNGMSAESLFPRSPDAIQNLASQVPEPDLVRKYSDSFFTQAVWDIIYHISSSALRILYPHYKSHQVYHPILVYIGTGIHLIKTKFGSTKANALIKLVQDQKVDYFVFPLQMQNDFQIRAYSKFSDLREAIRTVLISFATYAHKDSLLVIKLHPLDPGMINWRKFCQQLAQDLMVSDRVYFLDGGSLDNLLASTAGVVTINSTVGIWSLLAGKPLATLGEAVFNVPGLTHTDSLDNFWVNPPPPDLNLRDAFIRALAGTIQLRGVYYRQPGLGNAVAQAVCRLINNRINQAL